MYMSTACFRVSQKGNVVVFRHTGDCLDTSAPAQEHSKLFYQTHGIIESKWILSNTKHIHRWHVSIPKESQCNIGILHNETNEKQTYLLESFDASEFEDIYISSITITLTLDLKSNPASLYYIENGNSSYKNIICNNIRKGNNIKYKFIITEINSLSANYSIEVFKETINDWISSAPVQKKKIATCFLTNYDLNSISNIVTFARHTANCLVYGYISNNTILTIPRVIKELCLYYFIGS
eukprot:491337_1